MTSSTQTLTRIEKACGFLEAIEEATKNDNGAKAAMKRALSGEARHLRATYPVVLYPLLTQGITYNQDEWIFVACLFIYYSQPIIKEDKRNFGHSARGLAGETNSGGTDRRFRALLDTSLEDLRSPLSALVRQIKAQKKDISINYPKLIVDLCDWQRSEQYVQDNWAKAFWGVPTSSEGAKETSNDLGE